MVNELYILREIKHNGIIRLYEIYESDQYLYLIMEQIKGVGLITKIKSKNSYSEEDASKMIKSLITAVSCFHELRIIHRDLNPENLIAMY